MRRRSWLALGAVSATALVLGGGAIALLQPGVRDARLTAPARVVFRGVARAVLDGTLPKAEGARAQALDRLIDRVDGVVAALPPHAQAELSQLLALLSSSAGRLAVAGLSPDWEAATVPELQGALQDMRFSRLTLRRQAYQALHDIVGGAYFAEPGTWAVLGYPGPIPI